MQSCLQNTDNRVQLPTSSLNASNASVAQLVEQDFCKVEVVGSIPITSSNVCCPNVCNLFGNIYIRMLRSV